MNEEHTQSPAQGLARDADGARSDARVAAPLPMLKPLEIIRAAIAGVLMGIANLIPGVSGGTMVLALGLYDEFIDSVADFTALRFSFRRITFLAVVGLCAAGAIVGLAGVILYLLLHHTVAMFALFIGLTLGGAPLLLRGLRPWGGDATAATIAGLLLMIGVVFLRYIAGGGFPHNTPMDAASGLVGSTTMILPGISGSYMLLVLDQYERVVGAVDLLKDGLKARDTATLKAALWIVVPVGIGAMVGIVALSNLLKFLLHRAPRATHGVLLGILLGSVIGLWPFSQKPGEKALERLDTTELRSYATDQGIPTLETINAAGDEAEHAALVSHILGQWNERTVSDYTPAKFISAAALIVVGFAATLLLSRLDRGKDEVRSKK